MRAQGGGRIINFSDWMAKSGRPRYLGYVPYYVAKSGRHRADRSAGARAGAPTTSSSTRLRPARSSRRRGRRDEESKAVEEATPLGRWGGEMEIAKAVLALLDSDFITGETIRVDGGRHVK